MIRIIRQVYMPQVSRKVLQPIVRNKIRELFLDCICRCQDQKTAASFIDDLLTDTEKIMIAKRVAIALMLLKGYAPPDIEETLKVSRQTIWVMSAWLNAKGEGYREILEEVIERDERMEKEHEQALWEARETTPGRRTDWRTVRKHQWQLVRDTKVPF